MNTLIQSDPDCEDANFAPQGTEFLPGCGKIGFITEPQENAVALHGRARFGVNAFSLAASSAASIWQRDDPMPSVAEFFRVLQQCWRR